MISLNPQGKITEAIFMPKEKSFFKEECECMPGRQHFNIVFQQKKGEEIVDEIVILQTEDEKLADWCMDIISDSDYLVDWNAAKLTGYNS